MQNKMKIHGNQRKKKAGVRELANCKFEIIAL